MAPARRAGRKSQSYLSVGARRGVVVLTIQASRVPTWNVKAFSGSRWGGVWGSVSHVPADGRPLPSHDHNGKFFCHGLGVVVLRTRGPLFGRCQVPENGRAQAIEVDPVGHTIRSESGHNRTIAEPDRLSRRRRMTSAMHHLSAA